MREGEKGLLIADYLHALVWVWDDQEENPRCWHLLVRREVGAEAISHYCLQCADGHALARTGAGAGATLLHWAQFSRGEKRMRHD